ncbi:hypothetical protein A2U01_0052307, partial [Trifolium medium]|nr:hypothetical protein [Trifolium medium]
SAKQSSLSEQVLAERENLPPPIGLLTRVPLEC